MSEVQTLGDITVEPRFCGPPGSANGGYVAGRLAAFIDGPAEVTLRRPPPLELAMPVCRQADGSVVLTSDGELMAEARPASVAVAFGEVPTVANARLAANRTFPADLHLIPGCFVCGPQRLPGDGLRLHPGPVSPDDSDWSGMLATTWVPGTDLSETGSDRVRPEFIWAALDCPTAYACASPAGMPLILLGRQTVAIETLPMAGQELLVISAARGTEGRKHFAEAAIFTVDGSQLASCRATWIEVQPSQLRGSLSRA